jgi:hypothetical protein
MANTTVSIRERIKTPEGRWRGSQNLRPPDDKLKPSEAERKGKFYLVWTEGKKREQRVKGNFEAAVKAARAKERHLEDAADGFERPDPLCQSTRSRWRSAPKATNLIVRLIVVWMVCPVNPSFRRMPKPVLVTSTRAHLPSQF